MRSLSPTLHPHPVEAQPEEPRAAVGDLTSQHSCRLLTHDRTLQDVRWAFGLATAAIIATGAGYGVRTNPGQFDSNFYGFFLVALLPTFIYLVGVRDPRSIVLCGASLLAVTFLGWIFILQDDPMRGVGAVGAFPVTLLIATGFALHDRSDAARRRGG